MAMEEEQAESMIHESHIGAQEYVLKHALTPWQQKLSEQCRRQILHHDVLLDCVCGAGKTELVVGAISDALALGKRVCFAIARRQVVLEVADRLSQYFVQAKVAAVCGGHTDDLDGDLIVCTTHQLFRYPRVFDLLILDEPDAFPYRGDPVLHSIAANSCRGHVIYLSATPDAELKKRVKEGSLVHLQLYTRPHGKPIPVPKIVVAPLFVSVLILLHWLKDHASHGRMVFVPTISMAGWLGRLLSLREQCFVLTSKTENRDAVIEKFRNQKAELIIATTVLERGVTFPDVDVCVFQADHGVFDESSLIQMAGRAGRNFFNPYGDILFLCTQKSAAAIACRKTLENANAMSALS
jgi:competence protein ComFA